MTRTKKHRALLAKCVQLGGGCVRVQVQSARLVHELMKATQRRCGEPRDGLPIEWPYVPQRSCHGPGLVAKGHGLQRQMDREEWTTCRQHSEPRGCVESHGHSFRQRVIEIIRHSAVVHDQDIDVASRTSLAPRDRAKNSHCVNAGVPLNASDQFARLCETRFIWCCSEAAHATRVVVLKDVVGTISALDRRQLCEARRERAKAASSADVMCSACRRMRRQAGRRMRRPGEPHMCGSPPLPHVARATAPASKPVRAAGYPLPTAPRWVWTTIRVHMNVRSPPT